jgi:hypothetical protein
MGLPQKYSYQNFAMYQKFKKKKTCKKIIKYQELLWKIKFYTYWKKKTSRILLIEISKYFLYIYQ